MPAKSRKQNIKAVSGVLKNLYIRLKPTQWNVISDNNSSYPENLFIFKICIDLRTTYVLC